MSAPAAKASLNPKEKNRNSVLLNVTRPAEEKAHRKIMFVTVFGAEKHSRQTIRIFYSVLMNAAAGEVLYQCFGNPKEVKAMENGTIETDTTENKEPDMTVPDTGNDDFLTVFHDLLMEQQETA